jgi:hypothetical protein
MTWNNEQCSCGYDNRRYQTDGDNRQPAIGQTAQHLLRTTVCITANRLVYFTSYNWQWLNGISGSSIFHVQQQQRRSKPAAVLDNNRLAGRSSQQPAG